MDIRAFWPTAKWRPTGKERKRAKAAWKNNLAVLKRSVRSSQSAIDRMDVLTAKYQRKISLKFLKVSRVRFSSAKHYGWVAWAIFYETGFWPHPINGGSK